MRKQLVLVLSMLTTFCLSPRQVYSELRPVVGATLFGGAERGIEGKAGGVGGVEGFGLLPITNDFGLQASMQHQGGNAGAGGYRLGLSAGPVWGYSSGKLGLNVDYQFVDRTNSNFIFLRGVWAHYFDQFDFLLSYSQPVHRVQHERVTIFACTPFTRDKKIMSINELKAAVRFYPTQNFEFNLGALVNSFAGPDRNESGTGVGGIAGMSFKVVDSIVLNIFQGQMDSRSRYRVTSGVQFFWSPAKADKRNIVNRSDNLDSFTIAGGGGSVNTCGT